MSCIAIIPARKGSKRLLGKNMRMLAGKPMLAHTLAAALNSNVFDRIILTSDSEEALILGESMGVESIKRPDDLSTDTATLFEVCLNLLKSIEQKASCFALLQVSSPLRNSDDIRSAHEAFVSSGAECLMSISEYEYPPQWALWINPIKTIPHGYLCPYFDDTIKELRQNLVETYKHDGHIIMAKTEAFLKASDWLDMETVPWFTPPERAVDVDTLEQFEYVEWQMLKGTAQGRYLEDIKDYICRSSSTEEQLTCNEQVVGSSPTGGSGGGRIDER